MRLTVLGSAASYAGPGQACSGYLVRTETTSLLLDVGNGVLANLARVMDPLELDAVFVTHAHPDHILDIYALQALLRYAPSGPAAALDVFGPPGLCRQLHGILSEHGSRELDEAFVFHDLVPRQTVTVGDIGVTPRPVTHVDATFALVVDGCDDGSLCYTSDSALDHEVRAAAQGCSLLLAEATLPERFAGAAPHMTASEAGRLAAEAGAGRLLLTHIWPTNDRDETLAAARAEYTGAVEIARELEVYDVC